MQQPARHRELRTSRAASRWPRRRCSAGVGCVLPSGPATSRARLRQVDADLGDRHCSPPKKDNIVWFSAAVRSNNMGGPAVEPWSLWAHFREGPGRSGSRTWLVQPLARRCGG